MIRFSLILLVCFFALCAHAQDRSWLDSLSAYWGRLDAEYADSATSPLKADDRHHFTHIDHFAFDAAYRVNAHFTRTPDAKPFTMKTSTTRAPGFKAYGTFRFILNGQERTLTVYESVPPIPGYPNHLFLPFTDLSNGGETYGAGRYIDLEAPLSEQVELDFNKAYNPYCAYNDRYSCPVPPRENHLTTEVRAGAKKFHD